VTTKKLQGWNCWEVQGMTIIDPGLLERVGDGMTFDPKNDDQVILVEPLAMLKDFPDAFWENAPTFNSIYKNDYLRGEYDYKNHGRLPAQSYEDFPIWKQFDQQVLQITSRREGQYFNYDYTKAVPHTYVVLKIGEFYFRCNNSSRNLELYIPKEKDWFSLHRTLSYNSPKGLRTFIQKAQKAYKKIDSTWNSCRRSALRRLKKLDSPEMEKLKANEKKASRITETRSAVLKHIDSLIETLQSYKIKVETGEFDRDDAREVFDATNEMTACNGALKEAMGTVIDGKGQMVLCPNCDKVTALVAVVAGEEKFRCFRCGYHN